MSSGRTILLTGGSGKIGRAVLTHLLDLGHNVLITTLREETLAEVLHAYPGAAEAGRLHGWSLDLTEPNAVSELVRRVADLGLPPDALINNARNVNLLRIEPDGVVKRDNFTCEFLIDVIVPYELTMALADAPGSRLTQVVNIASMYGVVAANPGLYDDPRRESPIHYSIAKAALIHLTRELAVRLAGRGVRVNAVAFGGVEGRVVQTFKDRYSRLCPLGRMLRDDEVAGPVAFLLSDASSGMTGHNLVVDGGWSVW